MSEPAHIVRNSLIDKERSFSLGADALQWREPGGEGRMAYADVRDMRLIGYTALIGEAYQCTLRSRGGDKLKIRSAHYRSLGNFENRMDSYAPFIAALAQRIAAKAPEAKFIAGSNAMRVVWIIIGVASALLGLGAVLALVSGGRPAMAVASLAIAVIAVPLSLWRVRQDRGRSFDPASPPRSLLGRG